jgi:pyruvate kinase
MLSAETASGAFPVEAVSMMERIVCRVERDPLHRRIMNATHPVPQPTTGDAIIEAARQVADTVSAASIAAFSTSGSTILRASRCRPCVPILGMTPNLRTARRLALAWGVHAVHTEDVRSFTEMIDHACRIAAAEGLARPGDRLVITAGVPFGTPGATNTLHVNAIEPRHMRNT